MRTVATSSIFYIWIGVYRGAWGVYMAGLVSAKYTP
ncbi:Protein of unknown function [Bacillus cereus]|nr:Protein of unknown function [Bacillus cereus]